MHTLAVRWVPRSSTFTDCKLGSQRRLVLFMAWLTLLPARGPLPQTSQRFAIGNPLSQRVERNVAAGSVRDGGSTTTHE